MFKTVVKNVSNNVILDIFVKPVENASKSFLAFFVTSFKNLSDVIFVTPAITETQKQKKHLFCQFVFCFDNIVILYYIIHQLFLSKITHQYSTVHLQRIRF